MTAQMRQALSRCSGQAYVGAFLKRSAVTPPGAEAFPQQQPDSVDGLASASASGEQAATTDADIHTVGTFCQVHHISEMESGTAQMLLLGHRRLKRLHTVCFPFPTANYRPLLLRMQ